MRKFSCIILSVVLVFGSVVSVFSHGKETAKEPVAAQVPAVATDLTVLLRVPFLSPLFIETPVATVNGEQILLGEFSHEFDSGESDRVHVERFERHLKSLVAEKLAKQGKTSKLIDTYAVAKSIGQGTIELKAPIFSLDFTDTPVATVNEEVIRFGDFAQRIISMYQGMSDGEVASHDYGGLLERLVTVKLVVLEAKNIGIDETRSSMAQISGIKEKALTELLLLEQLKDTLPNMEDIEAVYKQVSQEVKLMTIQIDSQEDAQTFLETYQAQGEFKALADALVAQGKASLSNDGDYTHINELLPNIKTEIAQLEIGSVSQIYTASTDAYLMFKLLDRRFVENQALYLKIQSKNLEIEKQSRTLEYVETLKEKYVRYNKDVKAVLEFETLKNENPDLDLREYLQQFRDDQRTLVSFEGADDQKITVAEVVTKINDSFYHGLEETVTATRLNAEKYKALYKAEFKITSMLEAKKLGLDKNRRYLESVEKFTTSLLFETFLEKAIAPEVSITEEEVRQRYNERLSDFSSPVMLKMRSLVFETEKDARVAFARLKSKSDFKWVSANSSGMVDKGTKGVLPFDSKLLSATALPESIQKKAALAGTGDVLLFADPEKFFYVLFVDMAYPPKPKEYESVKHQIGQLIYKEKFQQILGHWVSKLKEVYETEIYLVSK